MPRILLVSEAESQPWGWTISVALDGRKVSADLTNPWSTVRKERLRWYYERWPSFPLVDDDKAERAVGILDEIGHHLGEVVLGDDQLRQAVDAALRDGDLRIEIQGSAPFQALPWETVLGPDGAPLATRVPLGRRPSTDGPKQTDPARLGRSGALRVVVFSARPYGATDVPPRAIVRPVLEEIAASGIDAQVDVVRPGTFQALETALAEASAGSVDIVHLDVHGLVGPVKEFDCRFLPDDEIPACGELAALFFESRDDGCAVGISAARLSRLMAQYRVPVVLVNACRSAMATEDGMSLTEQLARVGVAAVVGMRYIVHVDTARIALVSLYRSLLEGRELADAVRDARRALDQTPGSLVGYGRQVHIRDWVLPVLYQSRPVVVEECSAPRPMLLPAQRVPAQTIDRDVDEHQLVRILSVRGPVVAVTGVVGAGKSTFCRWVADEWQRTGFVDDVVVASDEDTEEMLRPGRRRLLVVDDADLVPEHKVPQLAATLEAVTRAGGMVVLSAKDPATPLLTTADGAVHCLGPLGHDVLRSVLERKLGARRFADIAGDLRVLLPALQGNPLLATAVAAPLAQSDPADVLDQLQDGRIPTPPAVVAAWSRLNTNTRQRLMALTPFGEVVTVSVLNRYQQLRGNADVDSVEPDLIALARVGLAVRVNQDVFIRHAGLAGILRPGLSDNPAFRQTVRDLCHEISERLDGSRLKSRQAGRHTALLHRATIEQAIRPTIVAGEPVALMVRCLMVAHGENHEAHRALLTRVCAHLARQRAQRSSEFLDREYLILRERQGSALAATSRFAEADEAYTEVQLLFDDLVRRGVVPASAVAQIRHQRGVVAERRCDYRAAADHYKAALEVDAAADGERGAGYTHRHLGIVLRRLGELERARPHLEHALTVAEKHKDDEARANAQAELGRLAAAAGDIPTANWHLEQAVHLTKRGHPDKLDRITDLLLESAHVARTEGAGRLTVGWTLANALARQALGYAAEARDTRGQSRAYHELGLVSYVQKHWNEAERRFLKAAALLETIDDKDALAIVYESLVNLYERMGKPWEQKAYQVRLGALR